MSQQKITFELNAKKSVEAILYVAEKVPQLNMYNLLKIIFEADKFHLNLHGRPVTGDVYQRKTYGTVPVTIYEMVKANANPLLLDEIEEKEYPFTVDGNRIVHGTRKFNRKYFSVSDLEALDRGVQEFGSLTFNQVKLKNHKERCWLETEPEAIIPFEKMIDNKEVLEDLLENPFRVAI